MRNVVKPECQYKCRFIQITDQLWLCPHASYGNASNRRGAVEEARILVERAGGYETLLRKVEKAEADKRDAQQKARFERAPVKVRYDSSGS